MDEQPDSSQQLMDILLVMDEKGTLQAVSGVKDGELQTKNPLEDNNDLLRVDRHGDMFSNFFSNLWNQLKDPTRFHFFRVPEEEMQRVAADFQQRTTQPVKEGEPLVAQYEVQPPVQGQQQAQAAGQQQQQQDGAPQQEQNPQYKYRPEDIDWNSLAAIGVQREQIERNGMLDQMLRGFQTDKTVRVHFRFEGLSHSNDSQLSLKPDSDGKLTVCSHGILDPEKVQKQFFGYDITDSDKQQLQQTGNMGHPATVTNRDGEQVEALVSRNLKTNELIAFPVGKVNIPAEKNGHKFTPDEVAKLRQGEAVVCQFITKPKEGQEPKSYLAPVQFSAAKMQLEFLFNERGKQAMDAYRAAQKQTANQEVPKTFRKQELTEKSRLELEAGGTVKVSGLVDKKGKQYHGYITWKPGEKPDFMFPKDYKAALEEGRVKPAVENEVQVAVNSQGKTNEATRNLKEALQSAQQRPTGEQKQRQDRKEQQKEDKKQEQKQEQTDKPKQRKGIRR
ncbi:MULTISPECIES: DUF4099 domain-containing protein [Bacteroides]|uniref:DUF4099 domain-containing protein n=1 Tax=Bacteroides TaxID=816 RepID=UPI00126A1192|nr:MULTISPECIES: DUF4099 domain-containing protein [Bacteroides]KAB3902574.1 DUF3945 domain-containing protein [Bacteroides uniformis]